MGRTECGSERVGIGVERRLEDPRVGLDASDVDGVDGRGKVAADTRFLAGLALNEEIIASAALRRRRVVRGGLAGVERVIAATACKAALPLIEVVAGR